MRVIVGHTYFYVPNMLDRCDSRSTLAEGEEVRVVNLHGAPKANIMHHCHVERLDGSFAGMVHTNSLHTRADYMVHLRERIARAKAAMAKSCGCPVDSDCIHDSSAIQ